MKTDSKEASYEAPLTRKIGLYIINPAKKCKASFFLEKGYSTFSFDKSRCLRDYVKNSDRISNGMTSCITLEIMQNKMQRQLHVFYTKKGYSTRGRSIEHFPFFSVSFFWHSCKVLQSTTISNYREHLEE